MLVLVPLVAALAATAVWRGGGAWWFAAGLVVGLTATLSALATEMGPAHIQNWKLGADGEKLTAKALEPLIAEGWDVRHDVQTRSGRGNIDHVLEGPSGTFALETKWLRGRIRVGGDVVVTTQFDDEDEVTSFRLGPRARACAAEVAADGVRRWVHAVVVLWGAFEQGIVEGDRVTFVHGDRLVEWLRSRPAR
jgi:hypothetical protein